MKGENNNWSSLLQYGFLAIPVAFASFPLYVLAPDFYVLEHKVKLSTLGISLLLLRLFDSIQDPVIGIISDYCRRYIILIMMLSAVILCCSIYCLFNMMIFSPIIWFVVCMGTATTAYSILSINHSALGALCTEDPDVQTLISSVREGFGLIGLVIAVSLPSLLIQITSKNLAYRYFSLVLFILTVVAFLVFVRWYRTGNKKIINMQKTVSFFACFQNFSTSSKKLLLIYACSMFASSIPAVLVIFFVRDLLQAEIYLGMFLLLYFLSGVFFMPLWRFISKKYGKYQGWFFAMLIASSSFIWAFFLEAGDILQYILICTASGAALGADLLFPPAILADNLYISQAESNASVYYSALTLTAKAALAIVSGFALITLESVGFTPDAKNSQGAVIGLKVAYALIPCALKCIAALMLWLMFINSKKERL